MWNLVTYYSACVGVVLNFKNSCTDMKTIQKSLQVSTLDYKKKNHIKQRKVKL